MLNANASFETGTAPWTATGGTLTQSSAQAYQGTFSGLITPGGGVRTFISSELIHVTAGQTITASAWVYSPSAYSGGTGITINWYDATRTYLTTTVGTAAAVPAATWTPLVPVAVNPGTVAGAAYAQLNVDMGTPAGGVTMFVDMAAVRGPFPSDVLDAQADIKLGSVWTPVTSYILQRDGTGTPISISRGRPDESAQTNPATLTCDINNRDGRFSVRNPTGPYFGMIGRNTPIRVSVPAQSTALRMADDTTSFAFTPTSAALNVAGDLELQIDVRLDGYTAAGTAIPLMNKWSGGGQFSWYLELQTAGQVRFWRSTTGSDFARVDSTLPLPPGRTALKVTYATSTGTVTYYTAPTIGGSWTQLGSAVTISGGGTIFASTAVVNIGSSVSSITGKVFALKVLSGIGGTVVASPDFTSATPGAATLTDAQGNVWTPGGTAAFSARSYRFHGEMSSLPTTWDTSGNDVWVPLAGGGILRRLGQGNAPIDSALKRALLSQTGTLAVHQYWPCEDLQSSASIGSAVGGPLMTIIGGTGDGSVTTTGPAFAADSSFLCSSPLPTVNGSSWLGQVPAYTSNGSIIVRFLMKVSTEPANTARIIRLITTGTCMEVSVYYGTGGALGIAGFSASGTVFDTGLFAFGAVNQQFWMSMELTPGAGSTINVALNAIAPGGTEGGTGSHSFTGTIGNVTAVYVDPFADMTGVTLGHISVQSAFESVFVLASPSTPNPLNAWQGELAGERFLRLCAENNIAGRCYGPPDTTVAMGAQSPSTLPQLLQEVEDADRGQMYEPRQALALGYRTQASILNQAPIVTIDYSLAHMGGGELKPTYDDQFTKNDETLQRGSGNVSGATYRYILNDGSAMSVSPPPNGVGDYTDSKTVNLAFDTQLPDEASWMVHVNTVNEARWPILPVNMARAAVAGMFYAVQDADIGDYLAVINPPGQLPPDPVKQLQLGTKETLGGFHYQLEFNAVPESPYETGIYDDPVYGRADTDGSTLSAGITTTATTFSVDPTDATKPLWTTSAADLPFDIGISGERMTVTQITGPPGNFLGGQNANFEGGIGTWAAAGNCGVAASSAQAHSGSGSMAMTSAAAGDMAAASCLAANILTQGRSCSPGDQIAASAWFRAAASSRTCEVGATFYTSAGVLISTIYNIGVSDATTGWTQATDGGQIFAPATAAFCLLAVKVVGAGGASEVHYVDDAMLADVTTGSTTRQTFTVARSVNGVVKTHNSGEDARLWFPPIYAML